MSHVYNSNAQKQGKSEVQGQPWLCSGFEASVGYRRHLKTLATNTSLQMKVAALGYLYSLEKVPVAKVVCKCGRGPAFSKSALENPKRGMYPPDPRSSSRSAKSDRGGNCLGHVISQVLRYVCSHTVDSQNEGAHQTPRPS